MQLAELRWPCSSATRDAASIELNMLPSSCRPWQHLALPLNSRQKSHGSPKRPGMSLSKDQSTCNGAISVLPTKFLLDVQNLRTSVWTVDTTGVPRILRHHQIRSKSELYRRRGVASVMPPSIALSCPCVTILSSMAIVRVKQT